MIITCTGGGVDAMINNDTITPTFDAPLVPVFFTLRVDGVSQEIDESFNITLVPHLRTLFKLEHEQGIFYPDIPITIVDRDCECKL